MGHIARNASTEATGVVRDRTRRRSPKQLPDDVQLLSWAAEQLGVSKATAYRLAESGRVPGAFKIGAQWRVSVPRFMREVHGVDP